MARHQCQSLPQRLSEHEVGMRKRGCSSYLELVRVAEGLFGDADLEDALLVLRNGMENPAEAQPGHGQGRGQGASQSVCVACDQMGRPFGLDLRT